MNRNTDRGTLITDSSGNVFQDMGRRDHEELLAKAMLSLVLTRAIKDRGLTQSAAAGVLGVAPSDVSDLVRGKLRRFSYERLIRLLVRLDVNVAIRISANPRKDRRAALTVEMG